MSEILWFIAGTAVGTFFGAAIRPAFVWAWAKMKAAFGWASDKVQKD